MRRLTRTDAAIALLQLKTARAENKEVSEYEAARIHIDFLFDDLLKAVHAGIPRSDLVSVIMIFGEVSRRVASDTLSKRLRAAGIQEDNQSQAKGKAKTEPAAPLKQAAVAPSAPAPAPVPVKETVLAKPRVIESPAVPAPAIARPAIPAAAGDDKYAHLRRPLISGKGFLGEEERWMTEDEMEKEKERRAAIERSSIIGAEIAKKNKESY